jgi:hypothetical protein
VLCANHSSDRNAARANVRREPLTRALDGRAVVSELELARYLVSPPQAAFSGRLSAIEPWDPDWQQVAVNEYRLVIATVASGETVADVRWFSACDSRHGKALQSPPRATLCCRKAT